MRVYAVIGEASQQLGGVKGENQIEMSIPRTSSDVVALANGTWGEATKTKVEQRDTLSTLYLKDLQSNALSIAGAIAENGNDEEANIESLRVARSSIKATFQASMFAIFTGA